VLVPDQMFQVMHVGIQIIWSVVTGFLPRSLPDSTGSAIWP
jgi:hypothetical protein